MSDSCKQCGAVLAAEMKFCTKCGSAAGAGAVPSASAATVAQDSAAHAVGNRASAETPAQSVFPSCAPAARIPKAVIIGALAVASALIAAGAILAVHRAREKVQELKATDNTQENLENLTAGTKGSGQKANPSSSADFSKNLAELQAAANAIAQSAQKQGAANPLSANPGISGTNSAPNSVSTPNSAPAPMPGSPAAIAAASAAADAALIPPLLPAQPPIVPVAGTGNPAHDWPLEYERTVGGPEADLVVRTGDINNLGFGWPQGFDPFSGQSTPAHQWPDINHIPPHAPDGTDRVMIGTSVMPIHMSVQHVAGKADQIVLDSALKPLMGDGYSGALGDCVFIRDNLATMAYLQTPSVLNKFAASCMRARQLTMPTPIVLSVGALPGKIDNILFQIFADDFQPREIHSHFQVSLNGTRIPTFEYAINSLDQGGPVGKLLTFELLPEYWPLLKSGTVKLLIDDPTTHEPDGYAIDFVRILVNPHNFKYQVSLTATVTDADTHKPITGAMVSAGLTSAAADRQGKCQLKGIPAGLVVATASAPGYDENSVPVDLPAGQGGNAEIQLHRHQESTAALEQAIAQTGMATIYGIHFDTDSSKIRGDSIPALNAVLGLIKNHSGSRWIIAGHTDNQGNGGHNQTLSESRSKSVIAWLTQHGADVSQLVPQGFGATRPVADNATANGRALNRRVEVALVN